MKRWMIIYTDPTGDTHCIVIAETVKAAERRFKQKYPSFAISSIKEVS